MSGSPSLRNRINTTVRDIPRSGIRDFFDIVTTMKDVISLGIGEPDFDTATVDEVIQAHSQGLQCLCSVA